MKVVFSKRLYTAVLMTPILPKSSKTESCLNFQYRLSDINVILRVAINDSATSMSLVTLVVMSYHNQTNVSDWNNVSVEFNNTFERLRFVAEKIGYTREFSYAALRKISIHNTTCPKPGSLAFSFSSSKFE